jgi:hypothetical protein
LKIHRKLALLCAILAALPIIAAAQSNEMVDALLNQDAARLDTAGYLLLAAGGVVDENSDAEQAFLALKRQGWIPMSAKPEDSLTADTLALITMKALKLDGGVMYSILPIPRYAYRELVFKEVMTSSASPGRIVSGEEVLRVLRLALDLKGGAK